TAAPADTATAEPPIVDLDALQPVAPRRYARIVDLPPEEALAAEYADEIAGGSVGPPAAEEVVHAQSADEERPLLAEIKDARDHRGRGRRGKAGRERRGKEKPEKKEARRPPAKAQPTPAPHPHPHPTAHPTPHAHPHPHAHAHAHPTPPPPPPPTPTPPPSPPP